MTGSDGRTMKISYNWLKEIVETDLDPRELASATDDGRTGGRRGRATR
jgi:hypothetical protein